MFATNPFAAVAGALPANAMQVFVIAMALAVLLGTLLDMIHKGSASYFFANWRKSRGKGAPVDVASIAVRTAVVDVLASGEFCNPRRRIAHLLTMYGFVLYLVTTAIMVFAYPTAATATPALLVQLWWLGGLMVLAGGYWFWFFIRVDVAAEGNSPWRVMRADLFILSLLASVTLGLVWAWLQVRGSAASGVLFGLYIGATTALFGRGVLVQVRAHVLQARSGLREAGFQGQWHVRQSAPADPRRSCTAGETLDGTAARCPHGHGARHQARSTAPLLRDSPQALSGTDQGASLCLRSST